MLRLLLASAVPGSQEECRTVVSECLGHLALLHPGPVLDQLEARLKDPSPDMRAVVSGVSREGASGQGFRCVCRYCCM